MFNDKITRRIVEDVKKVNKKKEAPLVSRDKLSDDQVPAGQASSGVNDVKPNTVVSVGQGTSRVDYVTGKPKDNVAALKTNPDASVEKSMGQPVTIVPRYAKTLLSTVMGKLKGNKKG